MLNPAAAGRSWMAMSAPPHGLLVPFAGADRYVVFTSGRVAQYSAHTGYSAGQLLVDSPFLSDTRLVGRSYGLVQHDHRGNKDMLSIIAGTSIQDLYSDFTKFEKTNVVLGSDIWAGIERHVTTYNLRTGGVQQTVHSYAHDNNEGHTYYKRIAFPAHAYLPSKSAAGSRLAYNFFDGSTWSIHMTTPGGSAVPIIWANQILWDVVETGPDTVELITSPVDRGRLVHVPNFVSSAGVPGSWKHAYYFPKQEIQIYRWTRSAESAALIKTLHDAIPYVSQPMAPDGTRESSQGYIYPVLFAMDKATRQFPVMITRNRAGQLEERRVDW